LLLSNKIFDQFNDALKARNAKGHYAEITFIGINSATIKEHKKNNSILQVTVDFVGEVITCIRDKEKKIISGNPEQIKKIYDTWIFSRDTKSTNPNWQLVDILS
jgi:predicted lipid-binding transport protein (Tim44 family)